MKTKKGWIKIHRQILDWEWYDDIIVFKLFIHLLLKANIEDKKWHGIVIHRGQLLTSISSLIESTRGKNRNGSRKKRSLITYQQVRTALNKLKSTNEITMQATSTYTLITINNFDEYQSLTKSLTNEQQTNNKRITTTKEYKKNNKEKDFKLILKNGTPVAVEQ